MELTNEILAELIEKAIRRSIATDEKVSVKIDADIKEAFFILVNLVDEYDSAREGDGSYDIWGDFEGEGFRLNLHSARPSGRATLE